jgi:hypothetical protein
MQNGAVYENKRGFGGNAPNKLVVRAEGKGSEHASDPCCRHGQKLVSLYIRRLTKKEGEICKIFMSALGQC